MPFGPPERRSSERFPTHLKGWIADKTTPAPIECAIWDLSTTGVRLVVSEPAAIPLEFQLQIPDHEATARVRLVWTDGVHYGATFTD
ncbi:PilZ domain-containing protein [Microvirga sp. VF16]|uniref:PilZ domain-containing protein n=1 Tax=Microvirga sp. VF16 TaxID=2807101 RepID=UPI00193E1279|nr:PilZ domain-containing protein [Microvirga sp. VF16]QRM35487.1 PilZ domain-containing protein [Microvirga sp. VF16]